MNRTLPTSVVLTSALLAVALLAGCAQPAAVAPGPDQADAVPVTFAGKGPAVGPDLTATTAAAPRLVEGEWWKIRFTGALYTSDDLIRVVANATPDGYVFGMPHSAWIKEAIAYHAPAFGDVSPALSYSVHNKVFEPLRFPLTAGATWETNFAGPYTATVESADAHTAVIRYDAPASTDPTSTALCLLGTPCGGTIRMTYDAGLHEVSKMESALGGWEVVAHGFQFSGWVSVPQGEHTAIDYGTFGPAADNPLPMRTIHVDESFNRITVLHFILGMSPGEFRLTSTAPNGKVFVTELTGASGSKFSLFEVADPGGDWKQEDLTVGVGATYTMGIAYQQYDILVPDGDRRPSHGHEVVR
jgi:hypothetical protein